MNLKLLVSGLVFALFASMTMLFAQPTQAIQPCDTVGPVDFFGIPTWYKYLQCDEKGIPIIDSGGDNGPTDLWLIAAAILEIMLRLAAVIAVVYIMWAGFVYITSMGTPDKTAQARKQIINAAAGLAIAIVAATVVSEIVSILRPSGITLAGAATITRILQMAYAIGGALAVVMVVIGGLKYVTAAGDPSAINSARNTIIYALIGLVVVLFGSIITGYIAGAV